MEEVDRVGIHAADFNPTNDVSEDDCNVSRNELSDNGKRTMTYGFLASFYACGIVAGFDESIRSESPRRLLRHLIRIGVFLSKFLFLCRMIIVCRKTRKTTSRNNL